MAEFNKQLTVAQLYERWIGKHYEECTYNDNNEYDIMTKNGTTIEVKHDHQTSTGNIAIEWWCRDKPSGISVTKSDYHIFIFPLLNEVWKIKTKNLLKMIEDYKYGLTNENWTSDLYYKNVSGGDKDGSEEGRSKLYLFRRSDVEHLFDIWETNIPKYKKTIFK